MPLFEYSGFDAVGKKASGSLEATGRRAALQALQQQGVFATELRQTAAEQAGRIGLMTRLRRRVPLPDLSAATRQLATLLGAGLSLEEALTTVAGQQENAVLGRALSRAREELLEGAALHRALAARGGIFPPLYVNMIKVGESSGTLDQVLERLADFLEDQARMRSRVQAAMIYPLLMTLVGAVVLILLFTFVVPKVIGMLEDLGQTLPLVTRLLIGTSDLLVRWWWLLALAAALAIFAATRYARTEHGRRTLDRRALTLPLFGRLNLMIATARLARTLGTLLSSGVPLLSALDITAGMLQNRVLRDTLEQTAAGVREGESLAAPLRRSGVFPPMLVQMAAVGEKSGQLEEMLLRVASAYEHQADIAINSMLSLLQPLMILLMGGVIGFIVLAILLPIFQASQGLG
jgi:general secretion pathway protein F